MLTAITPAPHLVDGVFASNGIPVAVWALPDGGVRLEVGTTTADFTSDTEAEFLSLLVAEARLHSFSTVAAVENA